MVSIVVPVYNVEKYLKECIESILNQTYKNYELILVDDGSTDTSRSICDQYASRDNVTVIHKSNAGLGMARNSGIEVANGDYITFLDSDDFWGPTALEQLMCAVNENNADTCLGGYSRITNEGEILLKEAPVFEEYLNSADVRNKFFPRLMGSLPEKKDAFRPSVWNAIYSMKIIREHNVRFPSEREFIAEDIIFDIDYYCHSKTICLIDSTEYYYRITPGSLTKIYKPDRFDKVVQLYKEVYQRLKEKGYHEECWLRANRQFFVYLKACIGQENVKMSHRNKNDAICNISKICRNEFTRKLIKEYPVEKVGIAQRGFIFLVKIDAATILYLILCRKNKKRSGKA